MSKNIIVTGGARGIGRVIARHLLSLPLQHRVFLIDIEEDELTYCANVHLKQFHPRVNFVAANLRDLKAIAGIVKQAADWFGGRIDVLVNDAGIARPRWTDDRTMEDAAVLEEWQAYIDINLSAPFVVSQAVIPYMKDKAAKEADRKHLGGCILHISSFRAHRSDPNCEGYAATKAGLIGLTHAMAASCQQWDIRVNTILPGWISVKHENRNGDENGLTWEATHSAEQHEMHPVGRVGRGEDIAEAVEYLMSAGFISGQEIVIDGGANKVKHRKII